MATLHDQYRGYSIEQLLQALEVNAEPGSAHRAYLENLLSFRTAEMVNKQLAETASSIGRSAHILKSTLENSSDFLINAIKVSTETSAQSAKRIGEQITLLAGALEVASAELKSAGSQSAVLGRRLNLLTGVLALAALVSAGATAFYAWETKQQVDVMRQQIRRQSSLEQLPKASSPSAQPSQTRQ